MNATDSYFIVFSDPFSTRFFSPKKFSIRAYFFKNGTESLSFLYRENHYILCC